MTDIAIVAAVRTPIGSFRGAFAPLSAVDLGAAVVRGLLERCQLPAAAVDELIFGRAYRRLRAEPGAPDRAAGRPAGRHSGGHRQSGVRLRAESGSAGGAGDPLRRRRDRYRRRPGEHEQCSLSDAWRPRRPAFRPRQPAGQHDPDGLWDAFNDYHMGITAENLADAFDISRERQDAFAASSQRKAAAAIAAGRFREEIVPVSVPQGKSRRDS
nr:Acetyl-CoA acetyltransferase [Klebsiella pneumoniae]